MTLQKLFAIFVFTLCLVFTTPQLVAAAELPPGCDATKGTADAGNVSFKESAQKCGIDEAGGTGAARVDDTIKNIINMLLYVAGIVTVFMIIIGGFRFVTADGDSNTINKARMTITYAAMGLIVTVIAYSIVNFVLERI